MTETPRTDAAAKYNQAETMTIWDVARQLERDLAAAERQRDDHAAAVGALERDVKRMTLALSNIETIIDGKADADVQEGRYVGNDYASIQAQIDEARR